MSLIAWVGMAATCLAAGGLLTANGFGFAVLAAPFFLLFAPPAQAIQITVILALAVSLWVLPRLYRGIERPLLWRLALGSVIGLPFGIVAFTHADPLVVRGAAGALITVFAAVQGYNHYHRRPPSLVMHPIGDLVAGAAAGAATGLVGMPGPPLVIYLILVGAPSQVSRSTQIAFYALVFAATLASNAVFGGVPRADWIIAATLMPPTAIGAWLGTRVGGRLDDDAAKMLAIAVLGAAGLYTLAAAARLALW
jgi:uncharacterized protein